MTKYLENIQGKTMAGLLCLVVGGFLLIYVGSVVWAAGPTTPEQAKLVAADAAGGDHFGIKVAISGDTALVGANGDDDGGSASGSAYVLVRSGTTWTQQAKLTASDAAAGDQFGFVPQRLQRVDGLLTVLRACAT